MQSSTATTERYRHIPRQTNASSPSADDSDEIREDLTEAGFKTTIPSKRHRKQPIAHDADSYKDRNQAERLVSQLKRMRRVGTRDEKLGAMFLAMVHVACIASIVL